MDLEYPIELHDSHNDFPLAPVRESIPNERISLYAQKLSCLEKTSLKMSHDNLCYFCSMHEK